VKMLDEREGLCRPRICIARSLASRPGSAFWCWWPDRFNILFAIVVLWGMFWWTGADEAKPIVGEVAANSVAAPRGLRRRRRSKR